ncbi:MAG: hypothetical protein OIF48_01750 [Silicimonas sp.]|nr:hypothetical protein [Silicimonas sp.]
MNVVKELELVLDTEQELLLKGDYTRLQELLDRKAKLADLLAAQPPDLTAEECKTLAARASQNEALLSSARRGIQAAMSQLKEIKSGANQSTYTRAGDRQPMGRSVSVMQKY